MVLQVRKAKPRDAMKETNQEFVQSIYPNAKIYRGVGRYTVILDGVTPLKCLSNVRSTENLAWADAAKKLRRKSEKLQTR